MNKNLGILLWLSNCLYESNLWFGREGGDLLCLYLSSDHENWKQAENYMGTKFYEKRKCIDIKEAEGPECMDTGNCKQKFTSHLFIDQSRYS